jgi:hypothetical protein
MAESTKGKPRKLLRWLAASAAFMAACFLSSAAAVVAVAGLALDMSIDAELLAWSLVFAGFYALFGLWGPLALIVVVRVWEVPLLKLIGLAALSGAICGSLTCLVLSCLGG